MEKSTESKFILVKENPLNNWDVLASKGLILNNFSLTTLETFEVKKEYQKITTKSPVNFVIDVENYKKIIPFIFRLNESNKTTFILEQKNPLMDSEYYNSKKNMLDCGHGHVSKNCIGVYLMKSSSKNDADIGLYFELADDNSMSIAIDSKSENISIVLGKSSVVKTIIKSMLAIDFSNEIDLIPYK